MTNYCKRPIDNGLSIKKTHRERKQTKACGKLKSTFHKLIFNFKSRKYCQFMSRFIVWKIWLKNHIILQTSNGKKRSTIQNESGKNQLKSMVYKVRCLCIILSTLRCLYTYQVHVFWTTTSKTTESWGLLHPLLGTILNKKIQGKFAYVWQI